MIIWRRLEVQFNQESEGTLGPGGPLGPTARRARGATGPRRYAWCPRRSSRQHRAPWTMGALATAGDSSAPG
eukprot:3109795-Pyramimonas_sp.AAC.1